jgi:hypothetical protein
MHFAHTPKLGLLRVLVVVIALAGILASPAWAQREPARPRLVLLLVVDQMREDYLTRFRGDFGDGGFRRLMTNGAFFASAYYSYGSTTTGPGNTTIVTGRLPRQHGIIGNEWLQGGPANPAIKAAFFDPDAKILAGPGCKTEGRSARNLIGTALGDQLKLSNRFSRVFSVAIKDRGSIALGGKRPDAAFWWDLNTGQFVTSNYYMKELPGYVREFNNGHWPDRFIGGKWDRALPPAAYAVTYPLDPLWLTNTEGLGPEFPHVLPRPAVPAQPGPEFYTAVYSTPYGNDVTLEMARRILIGEHLGAGEATDMLCVGLSSFDAAGHLFGPESAEMMDFAVRTDRQIAVFLDSVDRTVGLNRCVVVLTADHGIGTAPRLANALGLGGGRTDLTAAIKNVNTKLNAIAALPGNADYVTAVALPWVFLNPLVNSLETETRERVLAAARQSLERADGVSRVFVDTELAGPSPLPDNLEQYLAWRCYFPGRSGELYLHLAPYWGIRGGNFAEHDTGTNHDRHVPILIMGGGARPGRYFTNADPADIAVTLSALMRIEPPEGAVGRVLNEALDPTEWVR